MPVSPGSKCGSYEILTAIGAGGMGQVYRARDSGLRRNVAVKVLSEGVANDADRLARFEREAHVLASLNHPNIAAIYGLERIDGTPLLIMELVPGQTLAERIKRGSLAIEDALPIAAQIAAALEAAHDKGIVHRDLKPANVIVTPEGQVKVLDFGLAKHLAGSTGSDFARDLSHSPTVTGDLASAGLILGTAAYMSPEQARGKAVDGRTDVWSSACFATSRSARGPRDMHVRRRMVEGVDPDLESCLANERGHVRMLPNALGFCKPSDDAFVSRRDHLEHTREESAVDPARLLRTGSTDVLRPPGPGRSTSGCALRAWPCRAPDPHRR